MADRINVLLGHLLIDIKMSSFECASEFKNDMELRPLKIDDYEKGFLSILSQLTVVGEINTYRAVFGNPNHVVMVIEDKLKGKIIGCATLMIEQKFTRNCGKIGHIEDVAVDASYRGQNLGLKIIDKLKSMAKSAGCYKARIKI